MTSQPFEVRVLNLALNPLREFIAKKSASQQMSAQESKCLVDRAWNPLFTPQSIVFAKAADSGFNGKSGIVSTPHRDQGDSAGSILGYRVLSRAQLNHCWLAMFTPKVLRSFLKQEPHAAKVPYYHRWLRLTPRRNWHQSASRRYWISAHQASYLLQSGIRRGYPTGCRHYLRAFAETIQETKMSPIQEAKMNRRNSMVRTGIMGGSALRAPFLRPRFPLLCHRPSTHLI